MTDRVPSFPTSIGVSDADSITLLGQDLAADLMGQVSFGELALWLVTQRRPTPSQVRVFEAHSRHRELVLDATSLVEVDATRRSPAELGLDWAALREPRLLEAHQEFLVHTPSTEPPAKPTSW